MGRIRRRDPLHSVHRSHPNRRLQCRPTTPSLVHSSTPPAHEAGGFVEPFWLFVKLFVKCQITQDDFVLVAQVAFPIEFVPNQLSAIIPLVIGGVFGIGVAHCVKRGRETCVESAVGSGEGNGKNQFRCTRDDQKEEGGARESAAIKRTGRYRLKSSKGLPLLTNPFPQLPRMNVSVLQRDGLFFRPCPRRGLSLCCFAGGEGV